MSKPVLHAQELTRRYHEGPQDLEVLRALSLTVAAGETLAILGRSGAGKTTLLNVLGGLDHPDSGTVRVAGEDLYACNERTRGHLRNAHLGFVYQLHHLLPEFTALENVAMPLMLGRSRVPDALQRAEEILGQVGLAGRMAHKPGELSGGERQRVAIARALVTRPGCVLADEPTGNLDRTTAEQVQNLLLQLNADLGIALVVVTHDEALAARMQRRLELSEGQLVEI